MFDYWDKYPELKDIEDGDMDAVKDESEEKEYDSDWLTREEWENLSDEDKSQRVLENYINRHNKSKWQIGRDYEMYIAYRCRKQNLFVKATGIEQRLEDLGRDIIAKSLDGKTYIIQCKCWSKEKLIREKHIAQIFGTAKEYEFSTGSLPGMVVPVLYSTTEFSETARRFAQMLGVQLKTEPLAEFPRIKCNIGSRGDKIFHLPIDQQYDTTVIEPEKGECYAWTVKEAMSRGFRRAIRHRPPSRG